MRKLVTFRSVDQLLPIPGADRIELAKIDGWQVIVKKGDFTVGHIGLFFEIDSLLPMADSRFKFLARDGSTKSHHRLKTMKMKGVLSQGLLLPPGDFPELFGALEDEYADLLKIEKYEIPEPGMTNSGLTLSTFPSFIRKTDLERCQNMPSEIQEAIDSGEEFEVSMKLDGSSMTVYVREDWDLADEGFLAHNFNVGVCSRNQELKEGEGRFWAAANGCHLPEALLLYAYKTNALLAIQGELIGQASDGSQKIQGNPEGINHYEFRIFDVYLIRFGRYANPYERHVFLRDLADCGAIISEVPIMGWKEKAQPIDGLLARAEGPSLYGPEREGVVYKSMTTDLRFKAISNKYLLGHDG